MSERQRTCIAIDLKSYYASVECMARGLDPMTTNLVVADISRTEKTICLAVSPSLKAYGIDDILFQLCQQRFIPCPIRLVIGAFACELLIGIISHITEPLKAAAPVGDDLCK